MIAGETEAILARQGVEAYDNFLFFGKKEEKEKKEKKPKKELTEEEKAARKEKRQQVLQTIGDQFKEGGLVSNVLGMFGIGGSNAAADPSDYEFGMTDTEPQKNKNAVPTVVWVVGGVVVLGLVAYGIIQAQKNKQARAIQPS